MEGEADGAVAWVCKDSSGLLVEEAARSVNVRFSLHAENLALLDALKCLNSRGFADRVLEEIDLESDSIYLVKMLQDIDIVSWEIQALIKECSDLFSKVKSYG